MNFLYIFVKIQKKKDDSCFIWGFLVTVATRGLLTFFQGVFLFKTTIAPDTQPCVCFVYLVSVLVISRQQNLSSERKAASDGVQIAGSKGGSFSVVLLSWNDFLLGMKQTFKE